MVLDLRRLAYISHPQKRYVASFRTQRYVASFRTYLMWPVFALILYSKGVPSGIRPCWNCANLTGRAARRPGEIGHLCHDPSQFTRFTDAHLIEMVEQLHMEAATLASRLTATQYATAIAKLTTEVGFHVEPASLLMDM